MNLGFTLKDAIHKIAVKFVPASLPTATKPYHLRAVQQPVLDIHDIALKAAVYNMATSPKVIEEGLSAGIELIFYLAADGYRINTPLFNLRTRIPGEYKGSETRLPDGKYPTARLSTSAFFRKYLREKVELEFAGIDSNGGFIAEAVDEATGREDELMTRGNILTINGEGLKIQGDEERKDLVGVFFLLESGVPIKASVIALNKPRTLKVLVPAELKKGESYRLAVETQSAVRSGGTLVKKVRDLRSEFSLVAA
jgi:hypothetical protein